MTGRSVYWHDGMFMWPHHMQLEERFRAQELSGHSRWNAHYNWGLRSIDIDPEALKNQRLDIRSLRARLRDGTQVSAPDDSPLPALDLNTALAGRDRVTVYLGVPLFKGDQANAPAEGVPQSPDQPTRHLVGSVDMEDENTGIDPQSIQVRSLNARLLLETQDLAGYEQMPILRVEKCPGNDTQVRLDPTYIPPLLACDGWPHLWQEILQDQYHKFGGLIESLANQVISRDISFDTHSSGDDELLGQLAVLNEAYATLNTLAFAEGVHPLQAYLELCRIAGQLAIFDKERRVPELPPYDHDDLGFCFSQVQHKLQAFKPRKAEYEERPFIGEGLRMQVALERSWLEPVWQMFVGVQSTLEAEKVRGLMKPGKLDMKIGSADRVDDIFNKGLAGLEFKPVVQVPSALPAPAGLTYFQILRESSAKEWLNVQKSSTLGIRFNEKRVVVNSQGTIQGQQVLTLNTGTGAAPTTTVQFTLFLVRQQA